MLSKMAYSKQGVVFFCLPPNLEFFIVKVITHILTLNRLYVTSGESAMETDTQLQARLCHTCAGSQWEQIGARHHHGIVVPLFSLHSANSCGIGEYPDLLPLCSWCHKIGFDTLQLLPLNDTGPETSPYGALSANALNPLHLGLSQLPFVAEDQELQQQIAVLRQFNQSPRILYKEVQQGKENFLRRYLQKYREKFLANQSYCTFRSSNCWVNAYALFKTLKILLNWQRWEDWPAPYRDPSPEFYRNLPADMEAEIECHIILQFLCFEQLQAVKQFASRSGVFIKGDIPILINWESDSVWFHRNLFDLNYIAGAPPDMYSKEGQKWGFPIYNWNELALQDFRWWIERLSIASSCYHLYRLDHIVGFFRIWAIPKEKTSKEGSFIPLGKEEWLPQGEMILKQMLQHCGMFPIGEDLGDVPPIVRESMRALGICGTKVMRWERRWEEDKSFIPPNAYPPESMSTVSTHDSETLHQWWEIYPQEARDFASVAGINYSEKMTPSLRKEILRACHHSGSLFHINLLQEYLALIPEMVSEKPEEERINIPGTFSDFNWSYRFKPQVEEIVNHAQLTQDFLSIKSQ